MKLLMNLFFTFAKIGMFTFGGGYAMISLIDHECVEVKHWITSDELMDITVIAESTPGPIAINCATYTGYKKAGIGGAVIATIGMVLPSFIIILLVSTFMDNLLQYDLAEKAFKGIRVAVGLLIIQAGITMTKKMMKTTSNKYISMGFVITFLVIVIILDILQIKFSTIYLIFLSGFLGLSVFSMIGKKAKK